MFLVVGSVRDHVQSAPDHPHIRLQYNLFREATSWMTRLNPDRVYVEAFAGKDVRAVDNPARALVDIKTIRAALEPIPDKGGPPTQALLYAAICELADRTQADNVSAQLEAPLYLAPAVP